MARISNKLSARDKFYIITNGEQTEKNYFELLKAKKSIYDVKIIFNNSDPIGLVEQAKKYTSEANQVWCVFDIDYTFEDRRLLPALKEAEENGIKIAYSNQAFEVWLISHFEKCEKELYAKDYKSILDKHIKNCKMNSEYSKSDKELLRDVFIPKYKDAMQNAKVVYQTYVRNFNTEHGSGRLPIWEWNSSTDVFRLIEALRLKG